MTFTKSEEAALIVLAELGAVTLGRLRLKVGPMVNWQGVIERNLVEVYRGTLIGDVVGLTDRGRKVLVTMDPVKFGMIPYLASPGSVVDRAFGYEAVQVLQSQGYTVEAAKFKSHTLTGKRKESDLITLFHMRVPQEMMDALLALPFQGREYGKELTYAPALGYPILYATISRGGLTPSRARALIKKHASDTKEWKHPLMIAVLDETQALRDVVRRSNHEMATDRAKFRTKPPTSPYLDHDLVQLVTVPLP